MPKSKSQKVCVFFTPTNTILKVYEKPKNQSKDSHAIDPHVIDPSSAPVPEPSVDAFPSRVPAQKRSKDSEERRLLEHAKLKAKWFLETAQVFQLKDKSLSELVKRPRNNKKDVKKAYKIMESMKDEPAQALSGIWKDKNGKIIACYLSDRFKVNSVSAFILLLILFSLLCIC
jgi:hypothetical protein